MPSPRVFTVLCCIAATVWMAAVILGGHLLRPNKQDFAQYYMGGSMVVAGEFDDLYPEPIEGSELNPGFAAGSTMRPAYREMAEQRGVGDQNRYFQPPPAALLLAPLGLLDYESAWWLWAGLLIASGLGLGLTACRIFESLGGGDGDNRFAGYGKGGLILMICCSPLMVRTLRTAQVSPIVGCALGIAMLDMMRRPGLRAAIGIVVAGVLKYISLGFLPLILVTRQWRLLATVLTISGGMLGVTLAIMGIEPFRVFFIDIAPRLDRSSTLPFNQSAYGVLARWTGQLPLATPVEWTLTIARWTALAAILVVLITRPRATWQQPAAVVAAAGALIAWSMLAGPVCWEHYFVYLCPWWGWLAFEAKQSKAWRVGAITAIALVWLPTPALIAFPLPEPLMSHMFFGLLLFGILAMLRVFKTPAEGTTDREIGRPSR
ncbi:MAG: glycosyltransferase family 87 protein [Planctomycetota bacterium]